MYAFPSVAMPDGAVEAARAAGKTPDALYALSLLEATGICVVPASGFKQRKGRYGFRTTFLSPDEKLAEAIAGLAAHHLAFREQYT